MMTKETYQTRTGLRQYRPVLSEKESWQALDNGKGFCLACGATQGGTEPDARKYTCESCAQPKVYGLEELILMGVAKVKYFGRGE
jgi:hypothetical protein